MMSQWPDKDCTYTSSCRGLFRSQAFLFLLLAFDVPALRWTLYKAVRGLFLLQLLKAPSSTARASRRLFCCHTRTVFRNKSATPLYKRMPCSLVKLQTSIEHSTRKVNACIRSANSAGELPEDNPTVSSKLRTRRIAQVQSLLTRTLCSLASSEASQGSEGCRLLDHSWKVLIS